MSFGSPATQRLPNEYPEMLGKKRTAQRGSGPERLRGEDFQVDANFGSEDDFVATEQVPDGGGAFGTGWKF